MVVATMPGDAAVMKASAGAAARPSSAARNMRHSSLAGREIVVRDLGDRLGRIRYLAALRKALAMLLQEARKVGCSRAAAGREGFAAEALHALRHIGLEADARLLAVIHHVDAAGPPCCSTTMAHRAPALCRASSARSTASPASSRIRRSVSTALRGRLPTWVVRIRLFAALHGLSR